MLLKLALAAALVLGAAGFGAASWAARPARPLTLVRVSARDYAFSLSRRSAPVGLVRFQVVNTGAVPHDFMIASRRTRLLRHGEQQLLTVSLNRRGRLAFRCTVAGHAALGMKGTFAVGAMPASAAATGSSTTATPTTAPSSAPMALTKVADFQRPVLAAAPLGDPPSSSSSSRPERSGRC